jgi:hypothetical protein
MGFMGVTFQYCLYAEMMPNLAGLGNPVRTRDRGNLRPAGEAFWFKYLYGLPRNQGNRIQIIKQD